MRKGIHPDFVESVISCACGNKVETRSIKKEMSIEICSQCHPFFTGEQRLLDVAGRVEKFQKKFGNDWKSSIQKKSKTIKKEADAKVEAAAKPVETVETVDAAKPVETKSTDTKPSDNAVESA